MPVEPIVQQFNAVESLDKRLEELLELHLGSLPIASYVSRRTSFATLGLFVPNHTAFTRPHDRGTAPVHMDLAVESGHVIAHGVARQMQCCGNVLVALALTHQTQYLSLARGQIGQ